MSDIPENLKYASTHEWVKLQDDNLVQVGISDFAQQELGDLVYVELPELGRKLTVAEQCAVVESVKTASDLYSPLSGEVVAVNQAIIDEPSLINEAVYASWLFTLRAENLSELELLMDATAYKHLIDK
ncbi:MAG: glycine cleavage system protein GcvH [Methylococcaceae bacterium]|nr:glycine cleavage system protein GcvH [Methylococcaceae bacterium]